MADIRNNAEFYQELDRLRQAFRDELKAREQGHPGLGFDYELHIVNDGLANLARQASLNPLPLESQRQADVGGMIRILTEAWSYHEPLANDLMDLCLYYLKKLN